jgi:hypothetical protein
LKKNSKVRTTIYSTPQRKKYHERKNSKAISEDEYGKTIVVKKQKKRNVSKISMNKLNGASS